MTGLPSIENQQANEAQAYASAPPVLRDITWGDHFARLVPELQVVVFGRCHTFDEFAATEGLEAAARWRDEGPYQQGRRYARSYSPLAPEGELGSVHVCTMVPITPEQFETAKAYGWDINALAGGGPDGIGVLRAVFTQPGWTGDRT